MDWKKYVKKTEFAKDADRIVNAFRVGKIITYQDLGNAPIKLGTNVCGYSTYQLVAQLREVIEAEQSADVPPVEAAVAASAAPEPEKADKGTEQQKEEAPTKRSGSRARSGASEAE